MYSPLDNKAYFKTKRLITSLHIMQTQVFNVEQETLLSAFGRNTVFLMM